MYWIRIIIEFFVEGFVLIVFLFLYCNGEKFFVCENGCFVL